MCITAYNWPHLCSIITTSQVINATYYGDRYVCQITVTPKSGDVALQMAPILAVANIASTVSIQFGK